MGADARRHFAGQVQKDESAGAAGRRCCTRHIDLQRKSFPAQRILRLNRG
jgi:hypothetical protein